MRRGKRQLVKKTALHGFAMQGFFVVAKVGLEPTTCGL
jgi:hypothetical protein